MSPRRKTQKERREETREQLLAAAARVFATRGFHATSLDAVAEEAGFSRGAVYYNFADKDELFLVMLERRCAERAQDLRDLFVAGAEPDSAETNRLAQLAAAHAFDAMTGDREWLALYLEFLAHAARDDAFRRAFAARTKAMRSTLESVVADRAQGVEHAIGMAPADLALAIDALGTGLAAEHMLHGDEAVPPDLFAKTLALLVDGVTARAAATISSTGGDGP
jgi:AcrR family transcriptional regulator